MFKIINAYLILLRVIRNDRTIQQVHANRRPFGHIQLGPLNEGTVIEINQKLAFQDSKVPRGVHLLHDPERTVLRVPQYS